MSFLKGIVLVIILSLVVVGLPGRADALVDDFEDDFWLPFTHFHLGDRAVAGYEVGLARSGTRSYHVGIWGWTVRDALAKRQRKLDLSEEEKKLLTRTKQVADLVAIYGKRAVYASSVYGVGPTTASKILAKMDETDKEFFNDLFEAKLKYITTRPYWNDPIAKPRLY